MAAILVLLGLVVPSVTTASARSSHVQMAAAIDPRAMITEIKGLSPTVIVSVSPTNPDYRRLSFELPVVTSSAVRAAISGYDVTLLRPDGTAVIDGSPMVGVGIDASSTLDSVRRVDWVMDFVPGLTVTVRARIPVGGADQLSSANGPYSIAGAVTYPGVHVSPAGAPEICPKLKVFGVRGSRDGLPDTGGSDSLLEAFATRIQSQIPGTDFEPIRYQAIPVGYGAVDYGLKYVDSRSDGIDQLTARLEGFTSHCPGTYYVLAGQSQGADVVGTGFFEHFRRAHPKAAKRLLTVILFGDPRFNPKQSKVDDGDYNTKRFGIWSLLPGGKADLRVVPSDFIARTRSYCMDGDPVCNFSLAGAIQCMQQESCVHLKYRERGWVRLAANWTIQRWRKQSR